MNKKIKDFTLENNDKDKYSIICHNCNTETIHHVISSYNEDTKQYVDERNSVDWRIKNQIIQCQGCEEVSFRTVSTFSEDYEFYDDAIHLNEKIEYFPARFEGLKKSINLYLLPQNIQDIYKETIFNIENEQNIMAGIGIRALIETVCKELEATGNNLYEKIDFLKKQSIITPDNTDILHKLRILGNKSAHEVQAHSSKQLKLSIKIIEHVLENTYIIPNEVKQVFN